MHVLNFKATFVVVTLIVVSADNWVHHVKRYAGWYAGYYTQFVDLWYESTELDQLGCEWKCIKEPTCYSATFSENGFTCRLNTKYRSFYYNGNMADQTSIVRKKLAYAVNDSIVGVNDWTVEIARNRCEILDLRLMTYEELDLARDVHNYYNKACGYVDDGVATKPLDINGMVNCSLIYPIAFCREP